MRKGIIICAAFFIIGMPLWPQPTGGRQDEISSIIGLRLEDLFLRYGAPQTVHAARGDEDWQDDVVFMYNEGDFYIHRDRVWQVALKAAYGMKIGDTKAVAILILADKALDRGDYMLYPISGSALPLSLRINFNADRISGIYIYRTDF